MNLRFLRRDKSPGQLKLERADATAVSRQREADAAELATLLPEDPREALRELFTRMEVPGSGTVAPTTVAEKIAERDYEDVHEGPDPWADDPFQDMDEEPLVDVLVDGETEQAPEEENVEAFRFDNPVVQTFVQQTFAELVRVAGGKDISENSIQLNEDGSLTVRLSATQKIELPDVAHNISFLPEYVVFVANNPDASTSDLEERFRSLRESSGVTDEVDEEEEEAA